MQYMYPFDQKLGKAIIATLFYFAIGLPTFSATPLFARFSTDRTTIHAGEAFQITLAIYVSGETLAPQISTDAFPSPDQLQLYPFQELPNETTTLDGLSYEIRKFRAWARAPQAGSITVAPHLMGIFIQTTRSFFMTQESRRSVNIPVETLAISINPLPIAERPADFSGLVGRFSFSVLPVPLNVALGDLITVTFTIEGDLLPDTYLKPSISSLPELKVYELKPVAGESTPTRQIFSQTIVPTNSNLIAIPTCSLSFYDTREMRYKTLTAGPFPIRYHAERVPVQAVYSPTQTTAKAGTTNAHELMPHSESRTLWAHLWQRLRHEESATLTGIKEIQVYLAPSESSQKLFSLKPGASVTLGATNESWIYISTPDGMGWIPTTAISP